MAMRDGVVVVLLSGVRRPMEPRESNRGWGRGREKSSPETGSGDGEREKLEGSWTRMGYNLGSLCVDGVSTNPHVDPPAPTIITFQIGLYL